VTLSHKRFAQKYKISIKNLDNLKLKDKVRELKDKVCELEDKNRELKDINRELYL
jgi:hypothetical protein